MLIRLLIYFILGVLVFRLAKNWLGGDTDGRQKVRQQPADQVDDVMIKDPFCGTYFPKREGVQLQINGDEIFFCSEKCRNGYVGQKTKN